MQLGPSELVISKHTKLFDFIHCLPILDPKMDAGIKVPTPVFPTNSINNSKMIALMDALLSKNIEWLGGRLLAMTTHSCLYFHVKPVNPPILLFMQLLSLQMMYQYKTIMDAQVFFEEDFMTDLSGFKLGFDDVLLDDKDKSEPDIEQ